MILFWFDSAVSCVAAFFNFVCLIVINSKRIIDSNNVCFKYWMAVGIFNTKNLFVFFTSSIENNIRNLEKKKSITHTSIHERDEGDHMRGVYTFLITSKKLKKKKKTSDEPK